MSDHGRFIWYELISPDIDNAKAIYCAVLGWKGNPMPSPGGGPPYTIFEADGVGVGGGMPLMDQMKAQGVPPSWTGYVCVDDCDAAAEEVKQLGGTVRQPPMDIPGVGRFAIVADPTGAVIAIMKPQPPPGAEPPERPARGKPGYASWRELYAGDLDKAWPFYAELFGWTKTGEHDMGPMGVYRLFGNRQDGELGGMMTKPAQVPVAAWSYYFEVPDINAAAQTVTSAGGQVLNGPMEVPDGSWIVQAMDPGGAQVAFVATKS
jgi:predicted enzyme related to lactoylglutathione lyase